MNCLALAYPIFWTHILLSISLAIFPICALAAFAIAIAGDKYDTRGAFLAALAIWLATSVLLYSAYQQLQSWWTEAFAALVMTSVSMLTIYVPMVLVRDADWIRGRLMAGLLGSVVATMIFPGVVLTASCGILGDCV